MATKDELITRGNELAEKHNEDELKSALKNAIAFNDNEERLSLQWALKKVTQSTDGHKFTKEETCAMQKRL